MKNPRDFAAGLMFAAIGACFAIGAHGYSIGTAARMGPGFFPFVLGLILSGIGILIALLALRPGVPEEGRIGRWALKPLFFILGANLMFGALLVGVPQIGIPQMGLVVAVYAMTLVASLAGDDFDTKSALLLASVLAIGGYVAFVELLNLQLPVWPAFLT
jgi:hypothetical protein